MWNIHNLVAVVFWNIPLETTNFFKVIFVF